MGMCSMLKVLLSRGLGVSTRLLALVNVVGISYVVLLASVALYLGPFEIVPTVYPPNGASLSGQQTACDSSWQHTFHFGLTWYLIVNVVGNYALTYLTDCSIETHRSGVLSSPHGAAVGGRRSGGSGPGAPLHGPRRANRLSTPPCTRGDALHGGSGGDALHGGIGPHATFTCRRCDRSDIPERSHHCRLCRGCILKRDHHCFFMGQCVGHRNQRYFVVFCLYVSLAGLYSSFLLVSYIVIITQRRGFRDADVSGSFWHVLAAILSDCWYRGERPVASYEMLLVGLYLAAISATVLGAIYFYWHLRMTLKGQTTYEAKKGIDTFRMSVSENYLDVFGSRGVLCWFLPIGGGTLPGCGVYTRRSRDSAPRDKAT